MDAVEMSSCFPGNVLSQRGAAPGRIDNAITCLAGSSHAPVISKRQPWYHGLG
ncbi:hypothetical protein KUV86_02945 [Halomonas sp. DP8Y7-3]|uniref:hypothetical protein n=1 Tax=Halomonas sp. DP8Y7-3 TaxID=2859079 RepID=UPI001C965A6D|nr:hypothetical protein [Halomonas sp. DP8Y7-3]MBY5928068.1 hypothetical protein [Halomonas sp. DP8Y7-3]